MTEHHHASRDNANPARDVSAELVALARQRGVTLATAESLTAGLVSADIAAVPGASEVLQGGIVAYHVAVKERLLGVDPTLLAERGPVDADVALAMARGAVHALAADIGIATTGVAGPTPHAGHPVGEVFVAVVWPAEGVTEVRRLALSGDRARIRRDSASHACDLAITTLLPQHGGDDTPR